MKKFIAITLALALAGCGSSNDFVQQGSNQPGSSNSLSGRVLSPNGTALAGVNVVVQERTSNETIGVTSGDDGNFILNLPPGVYDVTLDKEGDFTTATSFYGPVTVNSAVQRSFTLQGAGGRNAASVFGKIVSGDGTPEANRSVLLRPGFILADAEEQDFVPVQGVTDANGNFDLQLNTPDGTAFDLELQGSGGALQEFIDIKKMEKPCYAEIGLGTGSTTNVFRCNQSPPPSGVAVASQAALARQSPFVLLPFELGYTDENGGTAVFDDGGIGGTGQRLLREITRNGVPDNGPDKLVGVISNPDHETSIALDDNGSKLYTNIIYVNPDRPTYWKFTDERNDTYTLWVINTNNSDDPSVKNWHWVTYSSLEPGIKKISFYLKDL